MVPSVDGRIQSQFLVTNITSSQNRYPQNLSGPTYHSSPVSVCFCLLRQHHQPRPLKTTPRFRPVPTGSDCARIRLRAPSRSSTSHKSAAWVGGSNFRKRYLIYEVFWSILEYFGTWNKHWFAGFGPLLIFCNRGCLVALKDFIYRPRPQVHDQ